MAKGCIMEVRVNIYALPGDKVWVRNYRRDGAQEPGTVTAVRAMVLNPTESAVQYTVLLDRKTSNGRTMFLYVNSDGIR